MWKWLQPRYNFNFYTTKTLDACKEILIEAGDNGIKPEDNFRKMISRGRRAPYKHYIKVHEKINLATFEIDVHSPDVAIEFEIVGAMTPEQDGTRVEGTSRISRIEKSVVGFSAIYMSLVLVLPWLLADVKQEVVLYGVGIYIIFFFIMWASLWLNVFFRGDKIRKMLGGLIDGENPKQTGR